MTAEARALRNRVALMEQERAALEAERDRLITFVRRVAESKAATPIDAFAYEARKLLAGETPDER